MKAISVSSPPASLAPAAAARASDEAWFVAETNCADGTDGPDGIAGTGGTCFGPGGTGFGPVGGGFGCPDSEGFDLRAGGSGRPI
jgi:hypothetical protein